MQADQVVRLEVTAPVAEIILNRPEQRNALNRAVFEGIATALQDIEADDSVRVVVLRGEGPVFCAGNDLKERAGMSLDDLKARRRKGYAVFEKLERFPKPCIAVVHGAAVAAGIELSLCCDFIIAGPSASFRYPEGVRGAGGGTRRIPDVIGRAMAKELLFTGRRIEADEALRLRLVNRIVPDDDLLTAVREMATTIAKGRPLSLTMTKRAIDEGIDTESEEAQRLEQEAIDAAGAFRGKRS